jgi:parallel beta-helix repeat protein
MENSSMPSFSSVFLYDSSGNVLSNNTVTSNRFGGIALENSSDNTFYHNNFINNTPQVYSDGSPNTWDNGYPSGGNYWSDYSGVDQKCGTGQNMTGSDGIGDTPYIIDANNTDRYPLMAPFRMFSVGTWNGTAYSVDMVSNSTITNVSLNATAKTLSFNVTGSSSTGGFCRIAIPRAFMWCGNETQWSIVMEGNIGGLLVRFYPHLSIMTDANYTYICFAYAYSTPKVLITSTSAIPEFQSSMLLPLLMMIALLTGIIFNRKRNVNKYGARVR